MSYLVFARKWRPQNFDDVAGQEHIVTTLKNSLSSGRLAHAYIFAGPRGVGKTSTARILSKSLNCKDGPTLTPCNKCPSCVEITEARSLDVIEIDGASNRGIEEIRALRENVKFSPAHGQYKIYIIDEVHMLTTEAFNALLKTLEEPPAHVKFIFATTQPRKILSTIMSRCQFFEFRRISCIQIIQKLKEIAESEKLKVAEDVLLAIARASDGSLRDAESILDELFSFVNGKELRLFDVHSVLGIVEQDYLFELIDKIIKKDIVNALGLLDRLIDEGKDPNQLLLNLIEHYRNLMIAKVTELNHEKLLDLPQEVCQLIAKQAKDISLDNILSGFNILLNAQEMHRRIESLRIPLEIALVKLAHLGTSARQMNSAGNLAEKKEDFRKIEGGIEVKKAVEIDKSAKEDSAIEEDAKNKDGNGREERQREPTIDLQKIKELWNQFVEKLTKVKVSAAHYIEEGKPIRTQDNSLTIGFPKKSAFHMESLESKENRQILEKIWKDILQQEIRIKLEISSEVEDEGPEDSKQQQKDEIDPLLKSALDTFGGRVVRKE